MNAIFIFIKKNWKYIIIGFVLIAAIGWSIYSGIITRRAERDYRTAQTELNLARQKISDSNVLIGQLQSDNSKFAKIADGWAERDKQLEQIARRQEEIYRGLTSSVVRLQSGLSAIQSGITKLGNDNIQIKAELTGGSELISQSLRLIQQLQGSNQ